MDTNREVKIAIIVGLIMITGCLLAFIISKNKNKVDVNNIDLQVYKNVQLAGEESGMYYQCIIDSKDLPAINNEFKRIMNLKESNKESDITSKIDGIYKIVSGTNFIAFDADGSGHVYRNDTTGIYIYNSEMYQKIANACSYITAENIEAEKAKAEQEEQAKEENTTNTKKDTKKTTKTTKSSSTTKKTTKK